MKRWFFRRLMKWNSLLFKFASFQMIAYHTGSLHKSVANGGTDKLESSAQLRLKSIKYHKFE